MKVVVPELEILAAPTSSWKSDLGTKHIINIQLATRPFL
jgi:hypothetical protein